MEEHHWGGQGWNPAEEPEEEIVCNCKLHKLLITIPLYAFIVNKQKIK
jgi:hypothetical protein